MATVKTQHVREERWREYTRMMVFQQVDRNGNIQISQCANPAFGCELGFGVANSHEYIHAPSGD